jgi:hypothetical protein
MPPPPPELDVAAGYKWFQSAVPKLGLKLEAAKGAGDFLVVDHVERPAGTNYKFLSIAGRCCTSSSAEVVQVRVYCEGTKPVCC